MKNVYIRVSLICMIPSLSLLDMKVKASSGNPSAHNVQPSSLNRTEPRSLIKQYNQSNNKPSSNKPGNTNTITKQASRKKLSQDEFDPLATESAPSRTVDGLKLGDNQVSQTSDNKYIKIANLENTLASTPITPKEKTWSSYIKTPKFINDFYSKYFGKNKNLSEIELVELTNKTTTTILQENHVTPENVTAEQAKNINSLYERMKAALSNAGSWTANQFSSFVSASSQAVKNIMGKKQDRNLFDDSINDITNVDILDSSAPEIVIHSDGKNTYTGTNQNVFYPNDNGQNIYTGPAGSFTV